MKANDNTLYEGMKAIRLLEADQAQDLQLKQMSPKRVEGALFLDSGGLRAATEHLTSLDKQVLDDIPSTLGVSSRTRKRKSDSSDEPSSKVSRRTYDSQAIASVRRTLDPIDEDGFTTNLLNDEKARIQCRTYAMRMLCSTSLDKKNPMNLFNGLKMTLKTSDKSKIILVLGDVVHRQRGLLGRDTCVVLARSSAWPGRELAVKISWPNIHRDSEKKLMDAAKTKADEMAGEGKRHWVLDHLPEILHSQDFCSNDKDTSQRRLVELLTKAEHADGKTFIYEEHLLRITVSERLFPITDLTDVKDIAQVFFDVFRCHHWLYENPKILHRDISLNNMMYRKRHDNSKRKFEIFGVLNDFDLSSSLPFKDAASLHRIGTPPYMAHELLDQSDVSHLYRYDVEAFYYVLLMLCCRYEIVQSAEGKVMKELGLENDMPFQQWFDRTISWQVLSDFKHSFLHNYKVIPTTPSFSSFLPWLDALRFLFRKGISALGDSKTDLPLTCLQPHLKQLGTMQPSVPFDNETLGGYIIPTEIMELMSEIDGHSVKRSVDQ
ncbi:uncharacterized protein ARMOST_12400 [Armillaria ostoyae]|uniref:Protein kinase domain-containing protein n=1 Tax=Armillaria ostoyae TaxID=47428 RepID=A0A284RJV2_ARMOS|nr:uncharacterized protein ARMOST_12400 [Armillaria ostoyae]